MSKKPVKIKTYETLTADEWLRARHMMRTISRSECVVAGFPTTEFCRSLAKEVKKNNYALVSTGIATEALKWCRE